MADKRDNAVIVGRFQLVTHGHLAIVTSILEQWATLSICVSDPTQTVASDQENFVAYKYDDYFRRTELNFAPWQNPFTGAERVRMWNATLERAGLQRQVTCRAIPRLSLYPDYFNSQFPASDYDLVFGRSSDPYDKLKYQVLPEMLQRPVYVVDPPVIISASLAKAQIAAGRSWSEVLAPGFHEVFCAIGGPDRIVLSNTDPAAGSGKR